MSYEHLAGRLIETQRSMLGRSAVEIARSLEGITVDENGSVTTVEGNGREVVEALVQRYTDVLGSGAETRLVAAAREFEDDLVLPPSLGGPEDHADTDPDQPVQESSTVGPDGTTPVAVDSPTSAISDGGTVAYQPPTETDAPATDTADGSAAQMRDEAALREVASISNPVKVDYTVASSVPDATDNDIDLGSVYLLQQSDDSWQTPVSVVDAVVDALSNVTELEKDDIDAFVDTIDPSRLAATLNDERGNTVSFHCEEITVTFHRTGSLAVH